MSEISNRIVLLAAASMTALLWGCQEPAESIESVSQSTESQTILVFGASGKIGGLIVSDALARGHKVIGVSRRPESLSTDHVNFFAVSGDVTDIESFKALATSVDSIVISVAGGGDGNAPENTVHARAAMTATRALQAMNNPPYVIQVGGATTMFGDKEAMLKKLPFPAEDGTPLYGVVFGHRVALDVYQASDIDWSVITPPLAILGWSREGITDTQRVGTYRTSTTEMVEDADGKNSIYVYDLAAATVDELENRFFVRQRFTVGY